MSNLNPPTIQAFFTELAKFNALARLIEEAPIHSEQADHFYRVLQDALVAGQKIQRIMMCYDFEKAMMDLTDRAAFLKAHVRYFAKAEGMSEAEYARYFYTEEDVKVINGAPAVWGERAEAEQIIDVGEGVGRGMGGE